MQVKILGSAAGGGFPQWNCACRNCSSLRAGKFSGKTRSQTQVAISDEGQQWFLLGASPDLRIQIESTPELRAKNGVRQSPIAGVVLASADIDHAMGLLLMREFQPLQIYGTASVLHILREQNSMFGMLNRAPRQAVWTEVKPSETVELASVAEEKAGIRCEMVGLGASFPTYAKVAPSSDQREAVGGLILESRSGKRVAFMPAVPEIDNKLRQQLDSCDAMLFDGTFWSDNELLSVLGSGQTARQMGHVPVGPPEGSLQKLSGLRCPRKIFVHVNNTNPMLDESGAEYRMVRDAGWEVAEDGWQFEL